MKVLSRLALILSTAITLAAADLSGTWTGVVPARNNELQDITFRFVQTGETLTGKMYRDTTGVPIIDGKISGDRISFIVLSEEQVGNLFIEIKYMFTGSIKGAEIELTRERGANPALTTSNPNSRINQKPTFALKKLF
jgi:hypothetical protein